MEVKYDTVTTVKDDEEGGKNKKVSKTHSVEDFEVARNENGFVFFQTDKAIYRVREIVRFRALRLDRSLNPIEERMTLRIEVIQSII